MFQSGGSTKSMRYLWSLLALPKTKTDSATIFKALKEFFYAVYCQLVYAGDKCMTAQRICPAIYME